MNKIPESELILNSNGSIYHLGLRPQDIADTIITVGDPDRVDLVANRFDKILFTKHVREFKTITGELGNKLLTVISTGIGTDNIDIVLNELDALVNVDLDARIEKPNKKSLDIIRIGTSGCLQENIPIDSFLISSYGTGLEGMLLFYDYKQSADELNISQAMSKSFDFGINPITASASQSLIQKLNHDKRFFMGITYTATGFYGPQGRSIRLAPKEHAYIEKLANIKVGNLSVTNIEMETTGIYGLANLLGHRAISFNALLANRPLGQFSNNPKKTVNILIDEVLSRLA